MMCAPWGREGCNLDGFKENGISKMSDARTDTQCSNEDDDESEELEYSASTMMSAFSEATGFGIGKIGPRQLDKILRSTGYCASKRQRDLLIQQMSCSPDGKLSMEQLVMHAQRLKLKTEFQTEIREIRLAFHRAGGHIDGVNADELTAILKELGSGMHQDEVDLIVSRVPRNRRGLINLDTFIRCMYD